MFKHILCATDLQANHYNFCAKAVQLAKYHHAELTLLHVIEIPSSLVVAQNLGFTELMMPAKDDAQLVLQSLGEALHVPQSHQLLKIGSVKQHILETAAQHHCDLIVLGSDTAALPTMLGSTAYHVMHHAPCDVLMLRT